MSEIQNHDMSEIQNQVVQPPDPVEMSQTVTQPQSNSFFARYFSSRLNRRNFLVGLLLCVLLFFAIRYLNTYLLDVVKSTAFNSRVALLALPVLLGCFSFISLVVRRSNDRYRHPIVVALLLLPFINVFVLLFLAVIKGNDGENKHGSKPLPRINILFDLLKLR